MDINGWIVLEYSVSQKCFHEHSVGEMLSGNLGTIKRGFASDYVPIAIFPTQAECDKAFPQYEKVIRGEQ